MHASNTSEQGISDHVNTRLKHSAARGGFIPSHRPRFDFSITAPHRKEAKTRRRSVSMHLRYVTESIGLSSPLAVLSHNRACVDMVRQFSPRCALCVALGASGRRTTPWRNRCQPPQFFRYGWIRRGQGLAPMLDRDARPRRRSAKDVSRIKSPRLQHAESGIDWGLGAGEGKYDCDTECFSMPRRKAQARSTGLQDSAPQWSGEKHPTRSSCVTAGITTET